MKLPSFADAEAAILALGKAAVGGPAVEAAAGLVGIVTDLFADTPKEQAALKSRYAEAKARTDAALDRLDSAIDAAEKSG